MPTVKKQSDRRILQYERRRAMPVSSDELFAWHARPGAFERLVPPWESIEVVERRGSIEDGDTLRLRMRRGPISLHWLAEHEGCDAPSGPNADGGFTDVQREGPFAVWRHRHHMLARPEGSELVDSISLRLPLAPLSHAIAGRSVLRDLERTFRYRHDVTHGDLALHAQHQDADRLTVGITGASGMIGETLSSMLTTGGHRVIRLVRRAADPERDEAQWDPHGGLPEPAQLEGVDAIVHLAGEPIAEGRWTEEKKRRILESREEGTRQLVDGLRALDDPPATFLCASAIGIYGDRGEIELDEDNELGDGFLAEVCKRWEAAARGASELGCRVVHGRIGIVLSPQGGALAKMLPIFKAGLGGPIGDGEQYMSWVSLDDVAGAMIHALLTDSVRGPINLTAPNPVTNEEFTSTLASVLSRPAVFRVPAFALKLGFGEMAEEALLGGQRVLPKRLVDSGYDHRHTELEQALRHLLGR